MNNLIKEFQLLVENYSPSKVVEAMNYSFLNGGKRLRPLLLIEVAKGYGVSEKRAIPYALALEMIHTYSLIHDDLPAMDNDSLRRGKKTCHLEFDEATAILAGDGLLTEAFSVIASSDEVNDIKVSAIQLLCECAGVNGMILGQSQDMEAEKKELTIDELKELHKNKTGKLFSAAFMLGAILAQHTEDISLWKEVGIDLGLAFQIQDDLFDVSKNMEELGKSTSDEVNEKTTSVSLLGEIGANELANQYFDSVYQKIDQIEFNNESICEIIKSIQTRNF